MTSGKADHCGCQTAKRLRESAIKKTVGKRYDHLTVIDALDSSYDSNNGSILYKCLCDCGNICYRRKFSLNRNGTHSCGCLDAEIHRKIGYNNAKDITGLKFGKLTALCFTGRTKKTPNGSTRIWLCICECGNYTEVTVNDLTQENTSSCGCLRESVGELKIKTILKKLNISFKKEKTFEDGVYPDTRYKFRFDFYLPDYNCCIEYDGSQHYQWSDNSNSFFTKEVVEKIQEKDRYKENFLKKKGIRLIRIPWTEKNKLDESYIQEILKKDVVLS